ncbi:hypothetical protein Cgig2_022352 [Carnegiea gigantea]|uniref:Uncharacterized protein n=1 Tax=Carnegiea gigantea TaxID=171969 RepID=A0A9Q1QHY2_9CARY|nr:hypothetical protein Cgig2_022352 [Carnegiea gigantea]
MGGDGGVKCWSVTVGLHSKTAMSSDKKSKSLNLFQKAEPVDFWNWDNNKTKKKKKNIKKWRLDEKRFSPSDFFSRKDPKETLILGPGAGAGVGCGAGIGFGLVGGIGYSGWPWNQLSLVFGVGMGCGVGAGFGYGLGFGRGSSWGSLKDDILGKKKKARKPCVVQI